MKRRGASSLAADARKRPWAIPRSPSKWRFLDSNAWQVSMYPAFDFPKRRDRVRILPDSRILARTFEMPFEIEGSLASVSFNADVGRNFHSARTPVMTDGLAGIATGGDLRRGWEVIGELHVVASPRFERKEWIAHVGNAHRRLEPGYPDDRVRSRHQE